MRRIATLVLLITASLFVSGCAAGFTSREPALHHRDYNNHGFYRGCGTRVLGYAPLDFNFEKSAVIVIQPCPPVLHLYWRTSTGLDFRFGIQ